MNNAVIKSVSDFAEVVTGGTPSTRKAEYWDGDIPWLNSGALNDGDIRAASRYITRFGLENSSAKLMPKDTILIALTGATTGQIGYLTFEACANQSVTGILPSRGLMRTADFPRKPRCAVYLSLSKCTGSYSLGSYSTGRVPGGCATCAATRPCSAAGLA